MTENKKTLLFSILGVILLLVVVIGVSYAMYTFSANGTKENVISTGTVSITYSESSTITLTNAYPSTDATGSAVTGHDLEFTVNAAITGSSTISYEVGLANMTHNGNLTENYVKFNLKKGETYLLGTSKTTGVTIGSVKSNAGTLLTQYRLDGGTLSKTNDSATYTLRAWISEDYNLTQNANTTEGTTQTNTSASGEYFKFGIQVKAAA